MGRRRPGPMGAVGGAVSDQSDRSDPQEVQLWVKARMDQRTRTQFPLLPALLRAVEQHRTDAAGRINTATATAAGGRFPAGDQDFQRCRPGESGRVYAIDLATTSGGTSPMRSRRRSGRGRRWKCCDTPGSASRRRWS